MSTANPPRRGTPGSAGPSTALYDPILVRHARKPYGFGAGGGAHACDTNRVCGDRICFHVDDPAGLGALTVRFEGEGCALSMGAASALCQAVDGRPWDGAREIARTLRDHLADRGAPLPNAGDLAHFAAVVDFPARIGCVSLAADVLLAALARHLNPTEEDPP